MSRKENNKTKSCQEQQKNLKLVLVGDTRSGKTSLAKRHTSSTFTNVSKYIFVKVYLL